VKVEQRQWTSAKGWSVLDEVAFPAAPQVVFVFGGRQVLQEGNHYDEIKQMYPQSKILMCSTAGEIYNTEVSDGSINLSAVYFEKSRVMLQVADISAPDDGYNVGKQLAGGLSTDELIHVMVFSDGLKVNGTSLVKGLTEALPPTVSVTGGLVGDGSDFKETLVGLDQNPVSGKIVVVGFYGESLKVGYGSFGGWDNFGPERMITKSDKNVLFELDGKPALQLYKEYLGDQAAGLPGSGLLFPMSLRLKNPNGEDIEIVRTVLAVDEEKQSMTFAGDMPEGVYARLMKANMDRLIEGAGTAASMSIKQFGDTKPELAILISCIGRKLVLKERTEEEVEAVRAVLGDQAAIAGFYSYGEICPTAPTEKHSQLHNQTMTITGFCED
jgi:hypothetical protein